MGWVVLPLRGAFVVVFTACAALPAAAAAATIHVTTKADRMASDGACSLREAVIAANNDTEGPGGDCTAGRGADAIVVPGGLYKLTLGPTGSDDATSGDLNLTQPVTIAGAGAAATTIDGNQTDRVFDSEANQVRISDLTVQDGKASGFGGGISAGTGSLDLTGVVLTENQADQGGGLGTLHAAVRVLDSTFSHNTGLIDGGGITNNNTLSAQGLQVTDNQSNRGAGIFQNGATMAVTGGSVDNNGDATTAQGGGLEIDGGPSTLTDVEVSGNSAYNVGAGLLTDTRTNEATTLSRVTVSDNTLIPPTPSFIGAGAGIWSIGATTLTDSWVHDNSAGHGSGGGIWFQPRNPDEQMQITGSTIGPSNRAANGDGIYLAGTSPSASVTITRSTLAANGDDLVSGKGGGMFVGARQTATLRDDTLAENKASSSTGGGNLYAAALSTVVWQNTLVALAFGGGNCDRGLTPTPPTMTSDGGNQEYGDSEHQCGFDQPNDVSSTTEVVGLDDLADNGGPTETMALEPGASPLNTGAGCQPTDQRGVPRPQGGTCDSGAYERDTIPPTVSITSGPTGTVSTRRVKFIFSANEPSTFACKLDAGAFVPCSSPFTSGPLPNGSHTFAVRATDIAGNTGGPASRAFTVKVEPALAITQVHETHRRWREGSKLPHFSAAKLPIGTTFSFALNEPAQVRFAFKHRTSGRLAGALQSDGHTGLNRLHFEGRISKRRKLPPGSYTLVIRASAHGHRPTSATLHFTIVAG